MTTGERGLSRMVNDKGNNALLHASNAPTQELSVDHFRRDMFDAAMQGLIDTLDRLYYLRMLIQSSVTYGGDLERVVGLSELDEPIRTMRRLAERVQHQHDTLLGAPLQLAEPDEEV